MHYLRQSADTQASMQMNARAAHSGAKLRDFKGCGGYSLLELSVALAVLAIVIMSSLYGTRQVLLNSRVNETLEQIPNVVSAVTASTESMASLQTLNTTHVANYGAFPAKVVSGTYLARTVANPFGGRYWIAGTGVTIGSTPAGQGYFLFVTGVPTDACATLVSGVSPAARAIYVFADPSRRFSVQPPVQNGPPATGFHLVKEFNGPGVNIPNLAAACAEARDLVMAVFVSRQDV